MPTPFYAWFRASQLTGGDVKGGVQVVGREDSVEGLAFDYQCYTPVDIHTGKPTGVRVHTAATMTMALDLASPVLKQHVTNGGTIDEIELQFFKIDPAGAEVNYYTFIFRKNRIIDVHYRIPNVKDKATEHYDHILDVSFVFEEVEETWMDGNITTVDKWLER
jgi:type VI secretion system secreted protein Hcp